MRALEGDRVLVRVIIGEAEKWHHVPLSWAIVGRLRREGLAGASVFRGIRGFGSASILRSPGILDFSADMPLVIEVVETEEVVRDRLIPILEEMVPKGLVTMEPVHVLRYHPGQTPPPPSMVRKPGRIRAALSKTKTKGKR